MFGPPIKPMGIIKLVCPPHPKENMAQMNWYVHLSQRMSQLNWCVHPTEYKKVEITDIGDGAPPTSYVRTFFIVEKDLLYLLRKSNFKTLYSIYESHIHTFEVNLKSAITRGNPSSCGQPSPFNRDLHTYELTC